METGPNAYPSQGCGRQEELVAYLYDEANTAEHAAFERHLGECAACRSELRAFERVRHDLNAWQLPLTPRVEITPQRSKLEALGELIGLFPVWTRALTAAAAAAAMVLVALAIANTRGGFGSRGAQMNPAPTASQSQASASGDSSFTRVEVESLINKAVARAQAQAQEETRAQLASLEARLNAAHEAKLIAIKAQLRSEHRAMLAQAVKQEPTIREWLFAANENRDTAGTENEKNN